MQVCKYESYGVRDGGATVEESSDARCRFLALNPTSPRLAAEPLPSLVQHLSGIIRFDFFCFFGDKFFIMDKSKGRSPGPNRLQSLPAPQDAPAKMQRSSSVALLDSTAEKWWIIAKTQR